MHVVFGREVHSARYGIEPTPSGPIFATIFIQGKSSRLPALAKIALLVEASEVRRSVLWGRVVGVKARVLCIERRVYHPRRIAIASTKVRGGGTVQDTITTDAIATNLLEGMIARGGRGPTQRNASAGWQACASTGFAIRECCFSNQMAIVDMQYGKGGKSGHH